MNNRSGKFKDWVDGTGAEHKHMQRSSFSAAVTHRATRKKTEKEEKASLRSFYGKYKVLICIAAVIIACFFFVTIFSMPEFGDPDNPANNEVVERYVGSAEEETGAENVIAGMILNYRGFDTFGESCVLFVAACCVMMLLWRDKNCWSDADTAALQSETQSEGRDVILSVVGKIVIPVILCFGICVLFNGHVSPGGGFSGGAILGASLIIFSAAYGSESVRHFLSERVYNIIRISGLCIYGVLFFVYIYCGANGIENGLSRLLVVVIDIAVGLVVMSTMFGFYAFYTKGEL